MASKTTPETIRTILELTWSIHFDRHSRTHVAFDVKPGRVLMIVRPKGCISPVSTRVFYTHEDFTAAKIVSILRGMAKAIGL